MPFIGACTGDTSTGGGGGGGCVGVEVRGSGARANRGSTILYCVVASSGGEETEGL